MRTGKKTGFSVLASTVALGASALGVSAFGNAPPDTAEAEATGQDFDVSSYDVRLGYLPEEKELTGVTDVTAKAGQDLGTLRLQLNFPTKSVEVDGVEAGFEAEKDGSGGLSALTVRPAEKITSGQEFTVRVTYAGDPGQARWLATTDGGVITSAGTRWFASHGTDRAALKVSATVPAGWSALSNGLKQDTGQDGDRETYRWATQEDLDPEASVMNIGPWEMEEAELADGKPAYYAYGKGLKGKAAPYVRKQQKIIDVLARKFGTPYPYSSAGALFVEPVDGNSPFLAPQARVNFAGPLTYWDEPSYVHEWAHQWFGVSVAAGEEQGDLMTSEAVAQYAAWLWDESNGENIDDRYRGEILELKDDPEWWARNSEENGLSAYNKGAYVLHALRHQVGTETFEATLKKWLTDNAGQVKGWKEMKELFAEESGQDLSEFFAQWASDKVPADRHLMPGGLGDS